MGTSKNRYFLSILGLSVLLSGCLGTQHLKDNEKLLYRQRITAPSHANSEAMRSLYVQRPNRKVLGLPIASLVGIYYWGERNYDQEKYVLKRDAVQKKFDARIANTTSQKKINNLELRKQKKVNKLNSYIENGNLRMQWGEPISVFDSSNVTATEDRFRDYLFSKGFFRNKVSSEINELGKLVTVNYKIEPGRPYRIDSVFFNVNDTTILSIVKENQKDSYIRLGQRYDQDDFTKERERLDLLLKDNGFYDFSRQYIDFNIDSISSPRRRLFVQVVINDPGKRGYHKQFRLDSINFTTDAGTVIPGTARETRPYRDIQYSYYDDNYNLKILSQRVFLEPGALYSRSKTLLTQRQLANTDAFKFININYDTADGRFIANIFSSPLPRYEWSNEAGVSVTQGYPGPFYNLSFRKRNIFNGLENFDLNGRFGFEGVASATSQENFYKSTEAGVNASLTFPQFIWPFNERVRFKLAKYNPKTRLLIGYAYTDRPEYRRTAILINGSYTWDNNRNRSYQLIPFNVSIIDTANLSTDFKKLLADQVRLGNFSLGNSFQPSFVNSIVFGVTWNQNYMRGSPERTSSYARVQVESGGTIWNFVDTKVVTDFDLQYYKYLRLSVDLRRVNMLNRSTTLAYRLNSGVAYPYAENNSLPYEKFFFAGGSNSIRAWRPRRLGPGSFRPDYSDDPVKDGIFDYSIESPADILLEASVELRKKLFGLVSGAIFIDAGNVWTFQQREKLDENNERVNAGNAQFKADQFYKEIAVGTGFGLRFDFTFLILRFDVGMKVYDPARLEGDRFVLDRVRFFRPYATKVGEGVFTDFKEPVIYNVGIGYSF